MDGKKIGQSKAIERYLAADFGMMGGSSVEAAQIDQLGETIRDLKEPWPFTILVAMQCKSDTGYQPCFIPR